MNYMSFIKLKEERGRLKFEHGWSYAQVGRWPETRFHLFKSLFIVKLSSCPIHNESTLKNP